jgi:hypothetical protein
MGFTDLEDFNSSQFTILNWTISSLAISVTILRLIVRIDHHKRLYWDDFLNVFGLTCLVIMAILNQFQRDTIFLIIDEQDNGTEGLVTPEATARQAKLQFVFLTLFWTCLWTIKLSFLMFYQRLFINVQGYMKWWWGVMAFCIVTWVACIMFNFLECSPLSRRFAMDIQGWPSLVFGKMIKTDANRCLCGKYQCWLCYLHDLHGHIYRCCCYGPPN